MSVYKEFSSSFSSFDRLSVGEIVVSGPECHCGYCRWEIRKDEAKCFHCGRYRLVKGVWGYIARGGPVCYCGYHGWFIGRDEVRCSHCDRYRLIKGVRGHLSEGPTCHCRCHGWFIGENEVRCSQCDRYRLIQALWGYLASDGPECHCGYHGWFIGKKEVRCSHCDRYRLLDGVYGYLLNEGVKCYCGRRNWFIGKDWARCGECDRYTRIGDFEIESPTKLTDYYLSSLSGRHKPLIPGGVGSLQTGLHLESRPLFDENGLLIANLLLNGTNGGFEALLGSGQSFSGFRAESGVNPNTYQLGYTVRDGAGNSIGFIDNNPGGLTFTPFGPFNPFIRMP